MTIYFSPSTSPSARLSATSSDPGPQISPEDPPVRCWRGSGRSLQLGSVTDLRATRKGLAQFRVVWDNGDTEWICATKFAFAD